MIKNNVTMTETAETLILYFMSRERIRFTTHMSKLRSNLRQKGLKIVDAEYNLFWKQLEESQAGKIQGKYFQWKGSFKIVMDALAVRNKENREVPGYRAVKVNPLNVTPKFVVLYRTESGELVTLSQQDLDKIERTIKDVAKYR